MIPNGNSQNVNRSMTPNAGYVSPLKTGLRMDPNCSAYQRKQSILQQQDHNLQQFDLGSQTPEKGGKKGQANNVLTDLLGTKGRLEAEYAKIPITVSGKGIAIKKRKEELEHELDQIEKVIYRARCCSANGGNQS